ncbi:glycosyltransferase [Luteimonas qiangzhengi]|uniref:glycosyltransferase n=1 Tax=Luteimonas sp. MJ146 TaxID=3129240 RepID=UPI0031B9F8D6
MTAPPTSHENPSSAPAQQFLQELSFCGRAGLHERSRKPVLLVLTSTYPRWTDDHEPSFVHELASRLTKYFIVHVLAPHSAGAARSETMEGVNVSRYVYAPNALELLVNNGGIAINLRRNRWKLLLIPSFLISQAWHTQRLIAKLRPDALHAHWIIPQGAVLPLISLVGAQIAPTLLTSHGADLYSMRSNFISAIKRWAIRKASSLTVVSEAMVGEARNLGATGVRVEPMGVNLTTLFVPPSRNGRSKSEILFVGRLVEKKGLRVLIEAMPMIKNRQPDAFLTVVGFGPEFTQLRDLVHELGLQDCVNFAGPKPQSDLPAYYQRAAVFVAPFIRATSGDQEGLGLVVVEALGCACPVVVSDLPQVRQTLNDGICATAVRPGCREALGKAVLQQLCTPYDSQVHQMNAANVRARFDWDTVAERYASVLMELVR